MRHNKKENTYKICLYQNDDACKNDDRLKPLTEDAAKVLVHLKKIFSDEKFSLDRVQGVSLQKGEILIFSNGFGFGATPWYIAWSRRTYQQPKSLATERIFISPR